MEKNQREYYLNEQLKAIQRELGNDNGEGGDDIAELQAKIDKLKLSKEARAKADAELKQLRAMTPMSADATVVRNYLDALLALPWGKKTKLKDRKSVVQGTSESVSVDLGGRRIIKKKNTTVESSSLSITTLTT